MYYYQRTSFIVNILVAHMTIIKDNTLYSLL